VARPESRWFAAVDLGSNSFRLVVAEETENAFRIVDRLREPVRLAAGLVGGCLAPDAKERALTCLRQFSQRIRGIPPENVRAVGTNTLRVARGDRMFFGAAEAALGVPIEVISGIEEARLIHLGVSHSFSGARQRHLVIDIGGGSTEIIIGEAYAPLYLESLYMGSVTFSQRFFPDGALTSENFQDAETAARLEIHRIKGHFCRVGWQCVIGASGTFKAVARVTEHKGRHFTVSAPALKKLRRKMEKAGHVEKLHFADLREDRILALPGGVAILSALCSEFGLAGIQVSDWALREGVIVDLIGRHRCRDMRFQGVVDMQKRFHVDMEQAGRVAKTALAFLDQVKAAWQLQNDEARHLLQWAASLHEIGLIVAHEAYHKHGAYLIENGDIAGFSRQNQWQLAYLVRAHRRKFPLVDPRLDRSLTRSMKRLAILLRLGVLYHHSRQDMSVAGVELSAGEKTLHIRFPAETLQNNPLIIADLRQEQDYLKPVKYQLTFS